MAPEIVTFLLSNVLLAVVATMAFAGLLGLTGCLRFTTCPQCMKWTILSARAGHGRVCLRCRHPLHHTTGAPRANIRHLSFRYPSIRHWLLRHRSITHRPAG